MSVISKKPKNNINAKKDGKITNISKTSFKSTDVKELKKKKKINKIVGTCKTEEIAPSKKIKKNKLSTPCLKSNVEKSLKNGGQNKLSKKVSKEKKNSQKEIKRKPNLQSQKDYMKKLKKKDPEFFKVIMNNKDVLEGTGYSDEEVSDAEEIESCDEEEDYSLDEEENNSPVDDEDEDDSFDEMEDSEASSKELKAGNARLVRANEDIEDGMEACSNEENSKKIMYSGKITKNMINEWKITIRNSKTAMSTFKCAEQALAAAIISIKGSDEDNLHSRYTVEGSQMFNSVVKFCLSEVAPALHKLFDLKSLSDRPTKNSNWKKLVLTNTAVKNYLKQLILLTKSITDASGIEVLLKKGILPILPIYVELPAVGWSLMKHMISLWCTSYEKVRVLSLIAIFRLIRSFKEELREKCMKALYASYVKNCHFTSPVSWPMIDFMRMSLVELYCLDQPLAYRHAFIYIRQLALHLRNALMVQKKERIQLVYNWQFIHCIRLWAELLGRTHPSKVLHPLIYPLVQVSIGTISLMKTPKYYPLVFHVCNILVELSKSTGQFIPVMPALLEILTNNRVHNRPKKTSLKPLQWDSVIKVSTSQMNESAFSDGVIDQVYDCLLNYLNAECASIGFPELVFLATMKIKTFQKKCKVPAYIKKMKHLIDLINENSSFIEQRRKYVQFSISDAKAIKDWEIATLQSSPPINSFYLHMKSIKEKSIKTEQTFDDNSTEAILKEKLGLGSKKKIGHHLLSKKDNEELEENIEDDDEEEELDIKEDMEEEELTQMPKSKKRKENSDAASNGNSPLKKKLKTSNTEDNEKLEDDIVKEMTFLESDESAAEEENNVDSEEGIDDESDSDNDDDGDSNEDAGSQVANDEDESDSEIDGESNDDGDEDESNSDDEDDDSNNDNDDESEDTD